VIAIGSKECLKKFSAVFFFLQFLVIKTLDPDPDSLEMLKFNESGSTTLVETAGAKERIKKTTA
jgi:hypothetical protein